ncbi:MAG: transcriptional regulator, partial [Hyphomicrobiales bacterium]
AAHMGLTRTRTGPKDPEMRKARVCYNHLAGELSVQTYDSFEAKGFFIPENGALGLSETGEAFFQRFGIDVGALEKQRRPLCKPCLDWSARRSHLACALGTALLGRIYDLGWAKRIKGSRIVRFSPNGEAQLKKAFFI